MGWGAEVCCGGAELGKEVRAGGPGLESLSRE